MRIGSGPSRIISFNLNNLLKGPVSECSPILRSWGWNLGDVVRAAHSPYRTLVGLS